MTQAARIYPEWVMQCDLRSLDPAIAIRQKGAVHVSKIGRTNEEARDIKRQLKEEHSTVDAEDGGMLYPALGDLTGQGWTQIRSRDARDEEVEDIRATNFYRKVDIT